MKVATLSQLRLLAPLALALGLNGIVACDDSEPALGDSGFDATVRADLAPPDACSLAPLCVGAAWPAWTLEDFQPKSPRLGQSYGLDAFKGSVTVVALLEAT